MKNVLYILGSLDDADAAWLVRSGKRVNVPDGHAIIREGQPIDSLFFVTGGTFRVTTGSKELARVGTGEVLGEISFVDARPPTATVTAVENGRVLSIPRTLLAEKLDADPNFASRFYRAIATFLAHRLRITLSSGPDAEPTNWDELDLDELHSFSQAGARFERILHRLQEV
jgi:CRP-like cAMP-binding protein